MYIFNPKSRNNCISICKTLSGLYPNSSKKENFFNELHDLNYPILYSLTDFSDKHVMLIIFNTKWPA